MLADSTGSGGYGYKDQFFFSKRTNGQFALYKTDGTPQGTVSVTLLEGGHGDSRYPPGSFTEAGGLLYFLHVYDNFGAMYDANDFWVTDGTAENTRLIKDTSGEPFVVYRRGGLTENKGSLYFKNYLPGETSKEFLYKIFGTPNDPIGIKSKTTTGIEAIVFPNPSQAMLHIQTREAIHKINIYDLYGKAVQTETRSIFSIEHLPAGVYLLQIETEKGHGTIRFVKQ